MRKHLPKLLALAGIAFVLPGCELVRFKGVESFESATTPVKYSTNDPNKEWKGDKGGFGGVANGSGGVDSRTTYGVGADPNSPAPVDPSYDQPAKGTGQQAGEFNGAASKGFGQTNSPAAQATASDVSSLSGRSAH